MDPTLPVANRNLPGTDDPEFEERRTHGARFVRSLRERARLTQETVAERAGLSVRGLAKIESGRVVPRAQTLARLCVALGCDDAATDAVFARYAQRAGATARETMLVGRDAMRDALVRRLERERFVVLYGPGGVGKSALAATLASDATSRGRATAVLEAAEIHDVEPLLAGLVRACDAPFEESRCSLERAARVLRHERRLVIVDTIERCDGAADALDALTASCPDLTVVATSRTAPGSKAGFAVTPLAREDAIALFERLADAAGGVADGAERQRAIAAACAAVDDVPLGIEVAAAALHFTPLETLGTVLARDLQLERATRDGPSRHRSLERSLAWSYEQLDDERRDALDVLASFARSAELGTLATIAGISLSAAIARFGSLVERNVAYATTGASGRTRLALYDVVREFARVREPLGTALGDPSLRHAAHYAQMVREIERNPRADRERLDTIAMREETDEFRRALTTYRERGMHDRVLALAVDLRYLWQSSATLDEARRWIRTALGEIDTRTLAPDLAADTQRLLAGVETNEGAYEAARERIDAALAALDSTPALRARCLLHQEQARVCGLMGDDPASLQAARDAERFARAAGDDHQLGNAIVARGAYLGRTGDIEGAAYAFRLALRIHRDATCCVRGTVLALANLALTYGDRAMHVLARRTFDEACDLATAVGSLYLTAYANAHRAEAALAAGDAGDACEAALTAAVAARKNHTRFLATRALALAANALERLGRRDDAATVRGIADGDDDARRGERDGGPREVERDPALRVAYERGLTLGPGDALRYLTELQTSR